MRAFFLIQTVIYCIIALEDSTSNLFVKKSKHHISKGKSCCDLNSRIIGFPLKIEIKSSIDKDIIKVKGLFKKKKLRKKVETVCDDCYEWLSKNVFIGNKIEDNKSLQKVSINTDSEFHSFYIIIDNKSKRIPVYSNSRQKFCFMINKKLNLYRFIIYLIYLVTIHIY